MRLNIFKTFFVLLLISGCAREEVFEPEVIARVGDRKLTSNEIAAWEASLRQNDIPQEVRSSFVRYWVEDELLYQASLDKSLDQDAWVAKRVDEFTRKILVGRLLEIEYSKITQPSPANIQSYFQQHSNEFVWVHIHLVVEYWRSKEKHSLERLRSNIQRGRNTGIWSGEAGSLENGKFELDGSESASPEVWSVVSRLLPWWLRPLQLSQPSIIICQFSYQLLPDHLS